MQLAEAIIGEWEDQIKHQKEQAQAQQDASGMGGMLGMGESAPPESPEMGGDEEDAEEEWSTGATTEESSPFTFDVEDETEDSDIGRIHEVLGLEKKESRSDSKKETALNLAVQLMSEARSCRQTPGLTLVEEDR